MEAVALSAEGLIGSGIGEPDLTHLLARLGPAIGADRAYVFENQTDARGTNLTRRRSAWMCPLDQSAPAHAGVWDFLILDVGLRRWAQLLRAGREISGAVTEFPAHEQRVLMSQGIQSILLVPIFVKDVWWGFLGLDSYSDTLNLSSAETDALALAAKVIGSSLDNALQQSAAQIRVHQLAALHDVSRTIGGTLAQNAVLQQTLEHICKLFDASTALAFLGDLLAGEALLGATACSALSEVDAPDRLSLRDSVTGQVIITGRPVFLESTAQTPLNSERIGTGDALSDRVLLELGTCLPEAKGTPNLAKSAAFVPLVVGEHVLGTLNIAFDRSKRFSADEKWLLGAIGQQAGIALANARLFQDTVSAEREARRRADQLAALHEIDRAINSSLEPLAVYARIVEQATGLLECDQASLLLVSTDSANASSVAYYASDQKADEREAVSLSIERNPFLQEILASQSAVAIVDSASDPRFREALQDLHPARAAIGLPLISRGDTIGLLLLADQEGPRQWQQDEIAIAAQLADQAAVAITNARLFSNEQQNRQMAETLQEIARIVNMSLELDQTLNLLLEQLAKLVPYDSAALFLNQDQKLRAAAGVGFPDIDAVLAVDINVDDNALFKTIVQSRHPIFLSDAQQEERFQGWAGAGDTRGWLGVPLLVGKELVGLLTVDSRTPGTYDEDSARRAMALADHTAVAIYKARLLDHLQRANRELRELDELKGQFIQNVAHELRTPLALVRGNVELIAQGELDASSQTAAINSALKHTRALVRLVENITTIQDLNVGELAVERLDPTELMDTAIQLASQKAIRTSIVFRRDYPENLPSVAGDFSVLAHAIYQLIDNAIKFSSSGGTVTLRMGQDARLRELEITVEDQGIGVPVGEQERIFELFYQTDGTTTRRFGGTGLGLAIVDRAIKMHGGRVWVESPISSRDYDQHGGSRFVIRLPYGPI
jgi:GAF domain-containing protein/anti-sigma regulatory factor (Ser/Thr protein kinase)